MTFYTENLHVTVHTHNIFKKSKNKTRCSKFPAAQHSLVVVYIYADYILNR